MCITNNVVNAQDSSTISPKTFFESHLVTLPLSQLHVLQYEYPVLCPLADQPAPPGALVSATGTLALVGRVVRGVRVVALGQHAVEGPFAAGQFDLGDEIEVPERLSGAKISVGTHEGNRS